MLQASKVRVGTNVVYGLLFFIIIAIAIGIGTLISVIISDDSFAYFALEGVLIVIFSVPILVLIIGIVQGRMAISNEEALIAGGVTGAVGYLIFMFIMIGTFLIGVSMKSPFSSTTDWGRIFGPLIPGFIHNGLIGALSAYFSLRFIFSPHPPPMPSYSHVSSIPQPGYEPTLKQQPGYTQQYQQPQQKFGRFGCPSCGSAFVAQVPDRPTMTNCTSCGAEVIIEPPY